MCAHAILHWSVIIVYSTPYSNTVNSRAPTPRTVPRATSPRGPHALHADTTCCVTCHVSPRPAHTPLILHPCATCSRAHTRSRATRRVVSSTVAFTSSVAIL